MVKFRYENIIFVILIISIPNGESFPYDNATSKALCVTQCGAFCMDDQKNCMGFCNAPISPDWIAHCDIPGCLGACGPLIPNFTDKRDLPSVPDIFISNIIDQEVTVSWSMSASKYQVLHVLQMRPVGQHWQTIAHATKDTTHTETIPDICKQYQFRVMAINQIGSYGFSYPVNVSDIVPGPVSNMSILNDRFLYYRITGEFGGIIKYAMVAGWNSSDIRSYNWEPLQSNCGQSMNSNGLPIFQSINTGEESTSASGIGVKIHGDGYGCTYVIQVQAVSRCGVKGVWKNFTIDLTDCHNIKQFPCPVSIPFRPPGSVKNVTLRADFGHPSVWLKIQWSPPSDLGSTGAINHYIMRWGKVTPPDPGNIIGQATYINQPSQANLGSNIIEFQIHVPREDSAAYGFQIIPIATNRRQGNITWDWYQVYFIGISRNSQIDSQISGSILRDEDGVKIVQFPNSLNIRLLWRLPKSKRFYNAYAIQLGKVVEGPPLIGATLVNKSVTMMSSVCKNLSYYTVCQPEDAGMTFRLDEPHTLYGVKIRGFIEDADTPKDDDWEESPLYIFTLHDPGGANGSNINTSDAGISAIDHFSNWLALCILLLLFVFVIIVLLICRKRYIRKKLTHLQNRILSPTDGHINEYDGIQPLFAPITGKNSVVLNVVHDKWEVPHSCVKVGKVLGQGAFGKVVKGRISRSVLGHRGVRLPADSKVIGTYVSVAVKMLQEDAQMTYKDDFLREIKLMKEIGYHNNVVSMLGCCTLRDPICVIVEHVPYGDLLTYLRDIRQTLRNREATEGHYINRSVDLLSPTDLMSFARQIAVGMEFLSQKGFIHRDLAARNILVGNNKTVKIGDFGLTRFIYNDKVYVNRNGGKLPLKWMSIEAIFELTFSPASDVWSFGIVLFEIVTLGGTPYPTIDTSDLLTELKRGYRMEKPDNCSEEMYQLMRSCWQEYPENRPSFSELRCILENMLEESSCLEYFSFSVDTNGIYYQVQPNEDLNNESTITTSGNIQKDGSLIEHGQLIEDTLEEDKISANKKTRFYDVVQYIDDDSSEDDPMTVDQQRVIQRVICDVHVEICEETNADLTNELDIKASCKCDSNDIERCKCFQDSNSTRNTDREEIKTAENFGDGAMIEKAPDNYDKVPNVENLTADSTPANVQPHFSSEDESSLNSGSSRHSISFFHDGIHANGFDADESSNNSRQDSERSSLSIEDEVFITENYSGLTSPVSPPFNSRYWRMNPSVVKLQSHKEFWMLNNLETEKCKMCAKHNDRFRIEPNDSGVSTSSCNDETVFTFRRSRYLVDSTSPLALACTDTSPWESDESLLNTYI